MPSVRNLAGLSKSQQSQSSSANLNATLNTSILNTLSNPIPVDCSVAKESPINTLEPACLATQQASSTSNPSRPTSEDTSFSHSDSIRSALFEIKLTLKALVAASDNTSYRGINFAFLGLLGVFEEIQEGSEIALGLIDLISLMKKLEYIFSRLSESNGPNFVLLEKLEIPIKSLYTKIEWASSRRTLPLFFKSNLKSHIDSLNQVINDAIVAIIQVQSPSVLDCQTSSAHILEGANSVQIDGGTFNAIAGDQIIYMDDKLQKRFQLLHKVSEAVYNSSAREFAPECLPYTRTKVLERIHAWVETEGTLLFWLNGVAGTGKSTIAHTIAKFYDQCQSRGASFFFSRDQQQRREIRYLFQTIAYQLGNAHPALKVEISKALEDEGILTLTLGDQLQKLILDPITRLNHLFLSPIVVTFDALDECEKQDHEEEHPVTHLIKLLVARLKDQRLPLKFFVTSRPEEDVRSAFEPSLVGSKTSPFVLHDVEPSEVDHDIGIFVESELADIAECNKEVLRGIQWPNPSDHAQLVKISAGLFIAAATAMKFIRQNDVCVEPQERLDIILGSSSEKPLYDANPFGHLDRMYTQILNSTLKDKLLAAVFPQLRLIIATIVLGYGRLTIHELACLLSQKEAWVMRIVGRLRSVILAPPRGPVRAFHLSFHDFLTDQNRCGDARFFIDARYYHREIARACLQRMTSLLKQDICQIRDCSKLNSDLDLDLLVRQYLQGDLQYSCRFWAFHFAECDPDKSLLEHINTFVFGHILHWMEALSLMGDLRNGFKSLQLASSQISSVLKKSNFIVKRLFQKRLLRLLNMLHDAERFLLEFFEVINASALHVYHSAFPFTPKRTMLYRTYKTQLTNTVQVVNGTGEKWNAYSRTMDGHLKTVTSVAISSDGTLITSGSADNTIRVWDPRIGASLRKLSGHLNSVTSVAISPDGTHIISGSDDNTIQIWDIRSGVSLRELTGHLDLVTSIAISHDGTHIISGSFDKSIRIWDAHSGASLRELIGHSDSVTSVAISHDKTRIISGSFDKTIRIWNVHNGASLRKLVEHLGWVTSVAISPDGTRIVSGSDDKTIRIWDARSGASLRKLAGHLYSVTSVVISLDGTRIISGSFDNAIRIWDAHSGACLRKLTGHSDSVTSVAISPDGTHIVSGSADNTIRIWDIRSGTSFGKLTGHSDLVMSMVISPDGTRVISSSDDKTIRIWDTHSGVSLRKLTGHLDSVTSVAISPDGTRIVSGSADSTVRIWDARSGASLRKLTGHWSSVRSVAISPDGTRIVSGSADNTIQIWDLRSGVSLRKLTGHLDSITSVAISLDETQIVSGSFDRTIRIWDAHSGATLHVLTGHSNSVRLVAISYDGTRIVSSSDDKTIRIWDARSGASLHEWNVSFSVHDIQFIDGDTSIFCGEGIFRIPRSALPLSPRKIDRKLIYNSPEGWFYDSDKRMCWVPPAYRGFVHAISSSVLVIGKRDGNVIIIQIPNARP